ncbi:MAG: hypothetical protein AABX01_00605 [Candidatus Micrarchaeota archaeon]
MNVKFVVVGALLIFLALVISVNAIEVKTSDDSISIHSTEGQFFAYVKNTAAERRNLYISVDGGKLNANVEEEGYSTSIAAGATDGALISVVAPDCFRGSELVQVYAQLCSKTTCETATRKVIVYVEPAKFCSSYIEGFAPSVQFIPGTATGSKDPFNVYTIDPKKSRIVFSDAFDTTDYSLRITGGDSCIDVLRGEVGRIRLSVTNRGAAGNFDFRVVTDTSLDAFPSKDYVALQRGASEEVFVDIKPGKDVQAVRQYVTLQALHLDELVAEKDVCIDIKDDFSTAIEAPSAVLGRTSKDMAIRVELTNKGTIPQYYSFSASNAQIQELISVDPQEFNLKPGAKKLIEVKVDTSKIKAGTYRIEYFTLSEETQESAETLLTVEKDSAGGITGASDVSIDLSNEKKDNVLTVFATIKNEQNVNLNDLEIEVRGLPESWTVSKIAPVSIRAGGSEIVEIEIIANSDETAIPKVVVLQNSKIITMGSLPEISGKAGGFTGLFTFSSQNIVLGLIILAGIFVFLMVGKRPEEGAMHGGHDPHGHLESIKHEATGGQDSHGSVGHGGH